MSQKQKIDNNVFSIPEGIEIRETGSYGKGLFATKSFKENDIVYESYCVLTEKQYLTDIDCDHFFVFDVKMNLYQVYEFDRYMNHSCDPNCLAIDSVYEGNKLYYKMLALKDINVGDQLYEDYSMFEYHDHKVFACNCGAPNCRGIVSGFKNLPLKEKLKLVSVCEQTIIEKWAEDDKKIKIIDVFSDIKKRFSFDLRGRQVLKEGDFTNEQGHHLENDRETIILKTDKKYYWCPNKKYIDISSINP